MQMSGDVFASSLHIIYSRGHQSLLSRGMISNKLVQLKNDLRSFINSEKAVFLPRFFKTGKGEYGEGDVFIGVTVPNSRQVAKKYKDLPLSDIEKLLNSKVHEERLVALFILVDQYNKGNIEDRGKIYKFYLKNCKRVNNWDLVDSSVSYIVGAYLSDKPKSILYTLAKSENLWERRMAIIATHYFIKHGEFADTLKLSQMLLYDKEDLIHKAVGWMLREVGKKNKQVLVDFLQKHYDRIPRTALRYAIEHFPQKLRRAYIEGKV